ncbi:Scr1 family TA system antitoxin-like transcriptional regulator [Streptomyces sp. HK10]|uniref:Scr1 family TA system antitoxin-like transcriptional regulator n=1 Tax=Streptomyces sp. HK10 TaxID=3373255 RepID=UPI003748A85C
MTSPSAAPASSSQVSAVLPSAGPCGPALGHGHRAPIELVVGLYLKALREAARMTLHEAAHAARTSAATISRLENGRTPLRGDAVDCLLRAYGAADWRLSAYFQQHLPPVNPREREREEKAADKAFRSAPWDVFADIAPGASERYALCHRAATAVMTYTLQTIPEPYRTDAYDAAVRTSEWSMPSLDGIEPSPVPVETGVPGPGSGQEMTLLLDEQALRAPVGGARVMAGQLRHLLKIIESGAATIRVVPFGAGWLPSPTHVSELVVHGHRLIAAHSLTPWYSTRSRHARTMSQMLRELREDLTASDSYDQIKAVADAMAAQDARTGPTGGPSPGVRASAADTADEERGRRP